jgi:hypothetical protein
MIAAVNWRSGNPGVALAISVACSAISVACAVAGWRRGRKRPAAAVGLALGGATAVAWLAVLLWLALNAR